LVNNLLRRKGWAVIRIWEHALKRGDSARAIARVRALIPDSRRT
jgi:very-short-patch-repair endonuclease